MFFSFNVFPEVVMSSDGQLLVALANVDAKLFRIAVALEKLAAYVKHVPEAIQGIDLGFEKEE
jgi:hypothetical protein